MWRIIKSSAVLAIVLLGISAAPARAAVETVKVPFPFVVRGRTLPAGDYRIQRTDQDPAVVMVRGADADNAKSSAFVLTIPADGRDPDGDQPILTFTHGGGQYRLATIWESGSEGRTVTG